MRMIVLFLTTMLCTLSHAQERLGQAWPEIIDGLRSQGISKVGGLDLNKFKADAQKITWKKNLQAAPDLVAGMRKSAYYIYKNNEIHVSKNLPTETLESLPDLELHELLGALRYEDNQYEISTSLRLLHETKSPELRQKLLNNFSNTLFTKERLKIYDGGSSVGGGGDIRALHIKNYILKKILSSRSSVSADFYRSYPLINFEPVDDPRMDVAVMRYWARGPEALKKLGYKERIPVYNNVQEMIYLYIPMNRWQDPRARAELLEEIEEKILVLFPSPGQQMIQVPICDKKFSISVPATQHLNILRLIRDRAETHANCHGLREWEHETFAPSFAEGIVVKNPGVHYYKCTFEWDGESFTQDLKFKDGEGSNLTTLWHISEDVIIGGRTLLNRKGEVTHMQLIYFMSTKVEYQTPLKSIKNLRDAWVILPSLDGKPLRYSCQKE